MNGKYDCPSHLSKDAKGLLTGMLNLDPSKRMSIADIRKSNFYMTYNKSEKIFNGEIELDD